jgi:hypothetical protein
MNYSSLPKYDNPSSTTADRSNRLVRKRDRQQGSLTPPRILIWLALVGVLGYFGWLLLSAINLPPPLSQAILGKWQATDGSGHGIELTQGGKVTIFRKDAVVLRGRYVLLPEEEIELIDLVTPTGKQMDGLARFKVSVTADELSLRHPNYHKVERENRYFPLIIDPFHLLGKQEVRFARKE